MKKIHEVKVAMAGETGCSAETLEDIFDSFAILATATNTDALNCLLEMIFSIINKFIGTDLQT